MKEIELTKGQVAIVDDKDYEWLSQYKWYAKESPCGYYAARTSKKDGKDYTVRMHRDIMGCTFGDGLVVDHINHNTLDNTRGNLDKCTQQQNMCNVTPQKGCTSKYKGVVFHKASGSWQARITYKGNRYLLGLFDSEEEAAIEYNKVAIKKHKHKALLNDLGNLKPEKKGRRRPKYTSNYKGVSWHTSKNKWRCTISYSNKSYHVGYYSSEEAAAIAYNNRLEELKNSGEKKCQNKIQKTMTVK